ncbi:MAG: hypothetical protein AAF456_18505 [Planctomycetota bacterium]
MASNLRSREPMVEQFIQLFAGESFRYSDELFQLLSSQSPAVTRSSDSEGSRGNLPCSHYLGIYRHRSASLARRNIGDAYWDDVCAAMDDLCDGLASTPDSPCCLWCIRDDVVEYVVFENTDSNTIAGCLRFDTTRQPER